MHDHLGSTRLSYTAAIDATDKITYNVMTMHDFLPYGKVWREYVNGKNDRFQFTGYELDGESGLNNALARLQDPELGRFLGVDPLMRSRPSWSTYNYSRNNPIRNTDPTGMLDGDYYSQRGIKVGTDGIDDGRNYVVGDDKEARSIQKSGGQVEQGSVKSAVELPSAAVRSEMQQVVGMDKAMPFQEHGGIFGRTEGGAEKVVMAESGGIADPSKDAFATINVMKAANPDEQGSLSNISGTFHTHPSGTKQTNSTDGNTIGSGMNYFFKPFPSPMDITNAGSRMERGIVSGNNYVLGMSSGQVSIYGGAGTVAKFPIDKFFSIGR